MKFEFNTEWLKGKRTYIMIAVAALDKIGELQGWWAPEAMRQLVELALYGTFLRMGVTSSGPVSK